MSEADDLYEPYVVVAAEGRRIGLMTCKRCGAAVMFDEAGVDGPQRHEEWHDRYRPTLVGAQRQGKTR